MKDKRYSLTTPERYALEIGDLNKQLRTLQAKYDELQGEYEKALKELADFKEGHRKRVDENMVLGCNLRTVSDELDSLKARYTSLKQLVGKLLPMIKTYNFDDFDKEKKILVNELKQAIGRE